MKARVLYVEDDNTHALRLQELLGYEGLDIIIAETANVGLKRAMEEEWDLLILDIRLGGQVSGLDILRAVRRESKRVPVVILTAVPDEEAQLAAWKGRAQGYFTKTVSHSVFAEALHSILESYPKADLSSVPAPTLSLRDEVPVTDPDYILRLSGNLTVDERTGQLSNGKRLGGKTFLLFTILWEKRNSRVSNAELIKGVWGDDPSYTSTNLNNEIGRLRAAIGAEYLENFRGKGYILRVPPPKER